VLATISYPPIPALELGPLTLSLHGLFAALGFLAGAWLLVRLAGRRGYDTLKIQSVLTWALVGSLLGARYLTAPAAIIDGVPLWEALNPIQGSFSIMGGFAGGILAGAFRARRLNMRFLPIASMAAPGLALGTVVGRVGDLAIVEHLGIATSSVLGYGVLPGYDLAPQHNGLECSVLPAGAEYCGVYHHTALYDLLGALVLLGVLLWLYRAWTTRHYGQLFAVWITWYGLQRFVIDFARYSPNDPVNADRILGAFTWSQWAGLGGALLGLVLFVLWWRTQPVESAEQDAAYQAESADDSVPADDAPGL
jgi:phosphatidylglycerol:prolipoprotein diacylglycerol transferase